jgi:hypothetical protein
MTASRIARTGRVQNWIDDPESRLPVSCTVFVVEDEMEGPDGIEASWRFVSHALRNGAGVAVHLSKLRERGMKMVKDSWRLDQSLLPEYIQRLNEILRGGAFTKTVLLSAILIILIQMPLNSSTHHVQNYHGLSGALTLMVPSLPVHLLS